MEHIKVIGQFVPVGGSVQMFIVRFVLAEFDLNSSVLLWLNIAYIMKWNLALSMLSSIENIQNCIYMARFLSDMVSSYLLRKKNLY